MCQLRFLLKVTVTNGKLADLDIISPDIVISTKIIIEDNALKSARFS